MHFHDQSPAVMPLKVLVVSDDADLTHQAQLRCRRIESQLGNVRFEAIEEVPARVIQKEDVPVVQADLVFVCLGSTRFMEGEALCSWLRALVTGAVSGRLAIVDHLTGPAEENYQWRVFLHALCRTSGNIDFIGEFNDSVGTGGERKASRQLAEVGRSQAPR